MCFDKDWYNRTHDVTKSNRVVYKVFRRKGDKFHSIQYQTHKEYSLGDTMYPDVKITDYEGLDRLSKLTYGVIHTFTSLDSISQAWFDCVFNKHDGFVIVKCIIPKNTVYWDNGNEIACMRLKLKEVICKPK